MTKLTDCKLSLSSAQRFYHKTRRILTQLISRWIIYGLSCEACDKHHTDTEKPTPNMWKLGTWQGVNRTTLKWLQQLKFSHISPFSAGKSGQMESCKHRRFDAFPCLPQLKTIPEAPIYNFVADEILISAALRARDNHIRSVRVCIYSRSNYRIRFHLNPARIKIKHELCVHIKKHWNSVRNSKLEAFRG